MYVPPHFAEDRADVVLGLVRAAGFGHLVAASADGIESTPLPFVVDDRLTTLRAHVARPNPIWKLAPCDGLLIIPVNDAYVSPNWYPSKAEHGKVVPTWNYEVVQLHGRLIAHDDAAWVDRQIRDMTDVNEANLPAPWSVDDAPSGYIDATRRGIVGIEVEITRVDAKRKLSQNRSEEDRAGVVRGLERASSRSAALRGAMRTPD